ncbi:MAG: outer membrane protein transport protein [Pseudomonadota bacterium]|nr:outer membrane protein transport protein [Pseudomonadota bacterium]
MVKQVSRLAVAVAAASLFSAGVQASGYKVNEQGAKHAGRAFAGSAAVADDASVVFFNPAGMSRLESSQASFGFTYLSLKGELDGVRTDGAGLTSDTEASATVPYGEAGTYNDGGNYMQDKVIPFGYLVHKLDDKAAVGFGIFAPFGTETDYKQGSIASGFADHTKLLTIDFQPSMSYKLSDTFSFGVGIDMVYAYGLLSKELDLVPLAAAYSAYANGQTTINPEDYRGYENEFEVSGDDTGYGWNFGFMWDITPATTLGFAYRSELDFELEGKAEFKTSEGVVAYSEDYGMVVPVDGATGSVAKQDARVPLTTPRSATFSLAHQYDDKLRLTAGATWTDWSVFKYFDVIATDEGIIDDIAGLGENYIGHIVEKWSDTWSLAVGADYVLNPEWTLRAGYAFDQSPVDDKHRTARVPDGDRNWLSVGASYNVSQQWTLDAALSYLIMDSVKVNEYNHDLNDDVDGLDNLSGEFNNNAIGFSFQANYRM